MDAKNWRLVTELFDQLTELPASEREAFLDAKCEGHPTLRRQVEKLLDVDGEAGDFLGLGEASERKAPRQPETAAMPALGDRLGPYKLLRELGSGGMGVVYLASPVRGVVH